VDRPRVSSGGRIGETDFDGTVGDLDETIATLGEVFRGLVCDHPAWLICDAAIGGDTPAG
jgi:hypothetical protein